MKAQMIILDAMNSLPAVNFLWNEFLCKLQEVREIQFAAATILTEDRSSA